MITAIHGFLTGCLLGLVWLLILLLPAPTPPQVPCRCGSAPVTSVVVLPDMVVRS